MGGEKPKVGVSKRMYNVRKGLGGAVGLLEKEDIIFFNKFV